MSTRKRVEVLPPRLTLSRGNKSAAKLIGHGRRHPRRVKKLNRRNHSQFGEVRCSRDVVAQFSISGAPWQRLNFLPEPQGEWVIATRNGRLVDRLSQTADVISHRIAAGKPVRMDVAGGRAIWSTKA